MVFRTRNCYYLRISERTVMPLYLYLDERHLEWMSDRTLQHVLADLRPNILPKLKGEAEIHSGAGNSSGKKSEVETHRGDTYQFCYFIRSTEPHSVVIKTRRYVAAPSRPKPAMQPSASGPIRKRKGPPASKEGLNINTRKKRKTKGKGKNRVEEEEDPSMSSDDDDDMYVPDDDLDVEMGDVNAAQEHPHALGTAENVIDLELEEEEEEKPKPILQLRYQGFNIYGQCLCVVVEPYPPVTATKAAPRAQLSTAALQGRSRLSVAPPSSTTNRQSREETPLFLPEDADQGVEFPDDPLYTMDQQDSDDDDPFSGVMAFTQALHSMGDNRPGAAEDDEEMDSAALFGDADEIREL